MRYIYPIILMIIFLFPQAAKCNDNTINWYHADFAPGIINEKGHFWDKGYHNILERHIKASLPEYKHVYRTANFRRILRQIQISNACSIALLKTASREKYVEFSNPTMVGMMNGIHILKKRINEFKPFIDDDGFISIDALFNKSKLKMGISNGRRYGSAIDKIITGHPDSDNIVIQYKGEVFARLIKVLQIEHGIDYVIGYPQEMKWLIFRGIVKDNFTFIPIKEEPRYVLSYVGCTKNKWGKKIISKINKVLKGTYYEPYKASYQNFLPHEAVKLHNKYVREVFP
ncbi:TIGR02285 family protein [Maridesulfovibrio hydrothermalis]|uniref:Solute-binding protein family 3/N-terminal domain-containing protein n=1 Tax=Maridesulfovibrio hydrothermalis AM13 = DSM 14728 TaxID=1121451 RepID=L0RDF2_9BACT|nr:TIGR02285 family protein [Maridesulfovibrio hydrothermalis]CCO24230.1 conserved protein of unknown function [Maridesulfovibrio hydrothermalis AM13 = DSM 14728]